MTLNEFELKDCDSQNILKRLSNGENIHNETLVLKNELKVEFLPKGLMVFNDIYIEKYGIHILNIEKPWFQGNNIYTKDTLKTNQ